MNALTDASLVIKLQHGDIDSLGLLYDRYRLTVYRTALGITRDPNAAEDILQETFLRFHAHIDRVDTRLPLAPWVYRIAVNLSYTWVTRHNRWTAPLEDFIDQLIGPAKYHPEPLAEQREDLQWMQSALDRLGVSQRVVVVLYYLNDLSLQEISGILEIPVGTVKSRLHYGRENLRQMLAGETSGGEVRYEFT